MGNLGMTRIVLALSILTLSVLACGEFVGTPTPASTPTAPAASATIPPVPTGTPSAVATVEDVKIAVVRQPVVRVRDAADGDPTGEYITAGQSVTVLKIDGDWVQIAEPSGWVFIGCLEGMSEKGCVAR